MKRYELKLLVKECLVELLQEGLGKELGSKVLNNNFSNKSIKSESLHKRKPEVNLRTPHQVPNNVAVKNMVNVLGAVIPTENPVMASIFADTAMKTLPDQLSNDHERMKPSMSNIGNSIPRGTPEQIVAQIEPTELFSEASQNWTSLAFAPNRNGKKVI